MKLHERARKFGPADRAERIAVGAVLHLSRNEVEERSQRIKENRERDEGERGGEARMGAGLLDGEQWRKTETGEEGRMG